MASNIKFLAIAFTILAIYGPPQVEGCEEILQLFAKVIFGAIDGIFEDPDKVTESRSDPNIIYYYVPQGSMGRAGMPMMPTPYNMNGMAGMPRMPMPYNVNGMAEGKMPERKLRGYADQGSNVIPSPAEY